MGIQPRRRAGGGLLVGKGVWRNWRRELADTIHPCMFGLSKLEAAF